MPGKVLKIDVVVDENGTARRALTEIEGGVKKVEAAAQQSSVGLTDLDKKLANWDDRIGEIEESLTGAGSAAASAEASMVGLSMGMPACLPWPGPPAPPSTPSAPTSRTPPSTTSSSPASSRSIGRPSMT
jgi:hypothetical protein